MTEDQLKTIKTLINENFKPAEVFDKIYGTDLSHKYDLSPYGENEIWDRWLKYMDGDKEPFNETLWILEKSFPWVNIKKYDNKIKNDIMLGMVSGFNPEDIYFFSIQKVPYYKNIEQKKLEKELPVEVVNNINWVLSPGSIQKIRNRFNLF